MTEQSEIIQFIRQYQSPELDAVTSKVISGEPLNPSEGLFLFEKGEPAYLGILADVVRKKFNGNKAWFIRNFHVEPTTICVNRCSFCSFSHHFSPSKWELSVDEILAKVDSQEKNVREIHITGAVHPGRDIVYYGDLLKKIRARRPGMHIKAYSAVELDYMIKKASMDFTSGLKYLKECGLDSVPGGGAEIFNETIRTSICGMKTSSKDWLEIHRSAHELGLGSNATMLYGHVETYAHRIDHLERLRQLQDITKGFNAFIPDKMHCPAKLHRAFQFSLHLCNSLSELVGCSHLGMFPYHVWHYAIGKGLAGCLGAVNEILDLISQILQEISAVNVVRDRVHHEITNFFRLEWQVNSCARPLPEPDSIAM